MRKLLLALPLASLILLAGCGNCTTGTCYESTPACKTGGCVAIPANAPITISKANGAIPTLTAEEYQSLLAAGKVQGVEAKATEEVAVAKPVWKDAPVQVVEVKEVAPAKASKTPVTVAKSGTSKDWEYVSGEELIDGRFVSIDEYRSQGAVAKR